MQSAMFMVSGQQAPNDDQSNGEQSIQNERFERSELNGDLRGINAPRPTRESVLRRLSEALMRRSLTVIDLSQRGLRPSDARLVKMALFRNSHLSVLKLGYNNLGDEGVTILAPGIASHSVLGSLDLGFNNVGDEGCRALASALSSCSVHTLYLSGNSFGEEGALVLAQVIGRSIQKLHFTGNRIGPDGVKAITDAVIGQQQHDRDDETDSAPMDCRSSAVLPDESGLQEIFLGGTGMGPVGCKAVARMLESSATIRVISLANCSLGDMELEVLSTSIERNSAKLPLEALELSFNEITWKGLECLLRALWGSVTFRELRIDNNNIRDRGAEHLAAILPHIKRLEVLDVGFNSIGSTGVQKLMRVIAQTHHVVSVSLSGNQIDTAAARLVAHALAYNYSLKSLSLDNCSIDLVGQRHITAGIVSNRRIALRNLTGFRLGPIIVTIKFPPALEHWTNKQVLNFLLLMWEHSDENSQSSHENEIDPLHFLPQIGSEPSARNRPMERPLDASIVVEVAARTFETLRDSGLEAFSPNPGAVYYEPSLGSPLAEDAIILEGLEEGMRKSNSTNAPFGLNMDTGDRLDQSSVGAAFTPLVAVVSAPPESNFRDPVRMKRIEDWLSKNARQLNYLARIPFSSTELWKLHQHYFAPVVNDPRSRASNKELVSLIVSSLPDVSRTNTGATEPSTITPSTQSSEDEHLFVGSSDPSLLATPPATSLPMLKRKVSYRFLGDAAISSSSCFGSEFHSVSINKSSISKLIEGGSVGHLMPPKSKRARRNRTRISFLPRIKEKLDSYLDTCHEKALTLMRQLHFVEQALLSAKIHAPPPNGRSCTHLSGVLAEEAEMILLDMM